MLRAVRKYHQHRHAITAFEGELRILGSGGSTAATAQLQLSFKLVDEDIEESPPLQNLHDTAPACVCCNALLLSSAICPPVVNARACRVSWPVSCQPLRLRHSPKTRRGQLAQDPWAMELIE